MLSNLFVLLAISQTLNSVGNYRSKASGNWGDLTTWQVKTSDAPITWEDATTLPVATSNVAIQEGHTVTLDVNRSINDIYIATNGGASNTGVLACSTIIIEVNGTLFGYNNAATTSTSTDGGYTANNSPAPNTITCGTGGKFRFVGNTRNLTVTSNWGGSGLTNSASVEFALNAGQTGTFNTSFKANNITLVSGIINMLTSRLAGDNGNAAGGGGMLQLSRVQL